MKSNLRHWVQDYLHAIHKQSHAFIYRKPPAHYLGYIQENRSPIILIPGVFEKWHFLKIIADDLSLKGHPIYVLEHLGYNTRSIPESAKLVDELITEKNLTNVVLIAHSKGGLIGKHLLSFFNQARKIKKLITIATPFAGSNIVKLLPGKVFKELHPSHEHIQGLLRNQDVNRQITSIYGVYDNHIWPNSSCHLEGAKNVQVDSHGHHAILAHPKVQEIIDYEIND